MKKLSRVLLLAVFCLSLFVVPSWAAESPAKAVITEMSGDAKVKMGDADWNAAEIGMVLPTGSSVKTGSGAMAVLSLEGGEEAAYVEVKENSELKIAELFNQISEGSKKTLLDLAIGEILITSKKLQTEKSKFEVKTPTSIVGVRGTTFSVSVETEK